MRPTTAVAIMCVLLILVVTATTLTGAPSDQSPSDPPFRDAVMTPEPTPNGTHYNEALGILESGTPTPDDPVIKPFVCTYDPENATPHRIRVTDGQACLDWAIENGYLTPGGNTS